ncbi:MAG: glycosidase [Thermoprotei archaeon]|nr:MAG: glycosidase [Thermoprotei archaeon]
MRIKWLSKLSNIPSPIESFKEALGAKEANSMRVFEINDIIKRLTVISRKNIAFSKIPSEEAIAVFNSAIAVFGNYVYLYPRVVLGYYLYVSAIAEVKIPVVDILENDVLDKKYKARIVISPDNRYDIWGTEDPRVYMLDGKLAMTYTGRTKYYFNSKVPTQKTFPMTAFRKELPGKKPSGENLWVKKYVHVPDNGTRLNLVSDKDAFLYRPGPSSDLLLFHRPHLVGDKFYTLISRVTRYEEGPNGIQEAVHGESIAVMEPAKYEIKIGWSTPPIRLNDKEIIAFLHGVDSDIEIYRLFAIHLEIDKNDVVVKAVTPRYIMSPREDYEIFGDRPHTVFPCGLWKLSDEEYLISYGAGDYFTGIGLINLNDLLAELDKGRIY